MCIHDLLTTKEAGTANVPSEARWQSLGRGWEAIPSLLGGTDLTATFYFIKWKDITNFISSQGTILVPFITSPDLLMV
jgi:hypothetical protein